MTLLTLILKNWKTLIPWIFIVGLLIFHSCSTSSLEKDIIDLQNQLSAKTELLKISEDQYESTAQLLDEISAENDELNDIIDDKDREIVALTSLSLEYKIKLDSISTFNPTNDTVYFQDTIIVVDSTARVFKYNYNDEIYLEGWYQTQDPFLLHLNTLKLLSNIEIAISENDNHQWFTNIATNSKFLSPKNIKTKITPFPSRWEYFYGLNVISESINILNPVGIGLHGGIKKGNYAGQLDIRTIGTDKFSGTFIGIGFTKYMEF